jgi:hypothetical protein
MKREVFLSQLVESISLSIDKMEEAMQKNDLENFQKSREELLKLKKEIDVELEK